MQKRKFLNFRPFVFIAVSLVLGIVSGSLFYFERYFFACLVCLAFALMNVALVLFTGEEVKSKLWFVIAFVLLFVVGLTSFLWSVNAFDGASLNSHHYAVKGRVIEQARTENGSKLILDDVEFDGDLKSDYKIAVYYYGEADVDIGDIVEFSEQVLDNSSVYEGRLSATNVSEGVKYYASINASDLVVVGNSKTIFEKIHLFVRDTINKGLGGEENSTAYALLIGQTEKMDLELLDSYRSSGVAHIFAVSGLHIGFLATVLNWLFTKLKMNKTLKAILTTFILLFYSGVCGFSSSSIRATIMSAVMLFSSIRGKRYDGLSSMGLACAIILLFSPLQLFCVGFQLSFIVVFGIILFAPSLARLLKFMPKKLANSISAVLCAWVVGIPVQLATFGSFSIFAILANFILLPVVGVIYVFLFVAVIIGGVFGIANITLFLPGFVLKLINIVIGALDYNAFIIGGLSLGIFAIFYYLALMFASGFFNLKNTKRIIAIVVCIAVCLVGNTALTTIENNGEQAYVLGSKTECATMIRGQEETLLIVSDFGKIPAMNRYEYLKKTTGVNEIDKLIFTNGAPDDMQVFVTRIKEVFEIREICYSGQEDLFAESIITKSFGIDVNYYEDGEMLSSESDCAFAIDGYAVELTINGNRVAIFSKFGSSYAGYNGLNGEYNLIIAVDYCEQIDHLYRSQEFISYRYSDVFKSAERLGLTCVNLK